MLKADVSNVALYSKAATFWVVAAWRRFFIHRNFVISHLSPASSFTQNCSISFSRFDFLDSDVIKFNKVESKKSNNLLKGVK